MEATVLVGIAGVVVTFTGSLITWNVAKRQQTKKKLAYLFEIVPIILSNEVDLARDLKISYKGEELPKPALLNVTIKNVGNSAIESANIIIQMPDTTYVMPGYFVDIPPGYTSLWNIERTDVDECTIKFQHINPKQTAKIRLLLDGIPSGDPQISCPMPNVEIVKSKDVAMGTIAHSIVSMIAPKLLESVHY